MLVSNLEARFMLSRPDACWQAAVHKALLPFHVFHTRSGCQPCELAIANSSSSKKYWGYIGIMENKMETIGIIGYILGYILKL